MIKLPELLAPAGNVEKLKAAIHYGADAVYLGGEKYGLRAAAGNFSLDEMRQGVQYAHDNKVRAYVTCNIFAHNEDIQGFDEYVSELKNIGVDAVILSDPGLLAICLENAPDMELHLSTQANNTNWASALFWKKHNISRIVVARELSLQEIKKIKEKTNMELEAFVHGAMCMSYSGRCLISNYMVGRDANRGECAQPCRWNYNLVEELRPGEYFPIEEDERGSYIFNSQDLSMIKYLPELIDAGIDSLKIEGRMKSVHYVATVVNAYRRALDEYAKNPLGYNFDPKWNQEILKVSHRDYTTGFYFGKPKAEDHNYDTSYIRHYDFVGVVLSYDQGKQEAVVEQRNKLFVGDELEFFSPQGDPINMVLEKMYDNNGVSLEAAPHPRMTIRIPMAQAVKPMDMIRRAKYGSINE